MSKDPLENEAIFDTSQAEEPQAEVEYWALVDLSYHGKHVLAGDIVSDIPAESLSWLLESHCIEKVS